MQYVSCRTVVLKTTDIYVKRRLRRKGRSVDWWWWWGYSMEVMGKTKRLFCGRDILKATEI